MYIYIYTYIYIYIYTDPCVFGFVCIYSHTHTHNTATAAELLDHSVCATRQTPLSFLSTHVAGVRVEGEGLTVEVKGLTFYQVAGSST